MRQGWRACTSIGPAPWPTSPSIPRRRMRRRFTTPCVGRGTGAFAKRRLSKRKRAPPRARCARGARGAHGTGHAPPVHRVGDPHRPDHPLLAAWQLAVRPRARAAIWAVARSPGFRPDLDRGLVGRVAIRVVRGALAATGRAHDDDPDRDRHPRELGVLRRRAAQGAHRSDAPADGDAREHDAEDEEAHVTDRVALLGRGARLESVTVAYNTLEGGVAVVAGLAAGSVALTGFGIDSVIEVASGVVLWWRFRAELGAARVGPAVEARAARWAGVLLVALAVYIVAESGRRLLTGDRPGESFVGIVLTALSLVAMPLLARAELRLAASLGSRALRADAHETIICAWLSATTLLGLGLNAVLGWWWADPVAALAMLPLIVREGIEAWREEGADREIAGRFGA